MDAVEQFKTHGMSASYHYADDSGKEWNLGDAEKAKALAVFDENPDHQAEMREVAKGFLWAYDFTLKRPNGPVERAAKPSARTGG